MFDNIVKKIDKENNVFDWNKIGRIARKTVSEGCVLVRNENNALPINKGEKVAVFGRSQFNYYKSGTGSGGAVNAPFVIGILDALKEKEDEGSLVIDKDVLGVYEEWLKDNPFEAGEGWAAEPWNQKEMPIEESFARTAAEKNDVAIFIIGRTAGEDKDNKVSEGSYLLTEIEKQALATVVNCFDRTAVVLNTGNIIDMKWVDEIKPQSVLYAWQGGMVGGYGVADILTGDANPSGRLSDTIAMNMENYPSTANFGSDTQNIYAEDIYVGYRYFETFAKDKVIYPFGYGLSYTTFETEIKTVVDDSDTVSFLIGVKNTGEVSGAQIVQIYVSKPQGAIGNPLRELVGFARTSEIEPGMTDTVNIDVPYANLVSYDDSGKTGYAFSYVALAGEYKFYVGDNVRDAVYAHSLNLQDTVCANTVKSALAPLIEFERMIPSMDENGAHVEYEKVPTRAFDITKRIKDNMPKDIPYAGDKGLKLIDVKENKASMEEFLSQLTDDDLIYLSRGEGMCSPKVTPGTASAFGGVTDSLKNFGIPAGCCADGPSGIRMDCGTPAFSMPNGTLLACTFDLPLVQRLYEMEGMDLRRNRVDLLLGPGINMHRNPLNGRNFEYFSEDPYLTGMMAVYQLRGMAKYGVSGTVKHFAGNEQEWKRYDTDSVVSERALREIYLKPFELAVKEGGAYSVMTTYGSLNGQYTAGNYDLNTTILRDEWGFEGIVMTDWWAAINDEGGEPSSSNTAQMIRSQNDLFMVVSDAFENSGRDNSKEGLANGVISRAELARNAANICKVLMKSLCMDAEAYGISEEWEQVGLPEGAIENIDWLRELAVDGEASIDLTDMPTDKGVICEIDLSLKRKGNYRLEFDMSSTASKIAQMPVSIFNGNGLIGTISIHGNEGVVETRSLDFLAEVVLSANIKLKFGMSGIRMHEFRVIKTEQNDRGTKFD